MSAPSGQAGWAFEAEMRPLPLARAVAQACSPTPLLFPGAPQALQAIAGVTSSDKGLHEFRLPGAAATAPRLPSLAKGAISGNQTVG